VSLLLLAKGSGAPYVALDRKIATMVDSFGSLSRFAASQASAPNGVLRLDAASGDYMPFVDALETFDLRGSSVYANFPNRPTLTTAIFGLYCVMGGGKYVEVQYSAAIMTAKWARTGSTPSSLTSSMAAKDWVRIRESQGHFYFDWSDDGTTWTQWADLGHPFTLAELDGSGLNISAIASSGNPVVVYADHINYTPPVDVPGVPATVPTPTEHETTYAAATIRSASVTSAPGDLLVATTLAEDRAMAIGLTGHSLTWELKADGYDPSTSTGRARIFTATETAALSTWSAQMTNSGGTFWFGMNVLRFPGCVTGAAASNYGSADAHINITTTSHDSSVLVAIADYSATSGNIRTWEGPGELPVLNGTEFTYFWNSLHYTVYLGLFQNVGAPGLKTYGLDAPVIGASGLAAIEIINPLGSPAVPALFDRRGASMVMM